MPTATAKVCHLPDTRIYLIEPSHLVFTQNCNLKVLKIDQPPSTHFVFVCSLSMLHQLFVTPSCHPDSCFPPHSLSVVFH